MSLNDRFLLRRQGFVDGAWIDADSGGTFAVHNPASGELVAMVAALGVNETRRAIDAAAKAQPAWAALSAKQRAAPMQRWFDLMMAHQDELAALMTEEQGKPLAEAKGEIAYGASYLEWFAEEGKRVYGDVIPSAASDRRIIVLKQPIGVCAAITPWNFPSAMIARKVGPALAAGCSIVVKPSELTPLSALALAELAQRAGLPAGVLNVLPSDAASAPLIGKLLCESPVIRKISFTGSTEVGRILLRQSADSIKKCSMELGGNAPFIVFDDADLEQAVKGAMLSKYRNAGQTCVCANRLLVQNGIYDAFARRLTEEVEKLMVGNGADTGITLGPLIEPAAVEKVELHVGDALARGARLVSGGHRHALGGNFFEPTVLAEVTASMRIFREETFGPVAPLVRFASEAEAIALANDTEFGLAAYLYTRDVGRVFRVSEALDYGMVGINEGIISSEAAPFGGVKQSGLGREGSKYGIEDYLEIKYLCLGGLQAP
jgi:succinate-semialdehyde dehydrogenase/glutarate-semialdehyde dehydrogenase